MFSNIKNFVKSAVKGAVKAAPGIARGAISAAPTVARVAANPYVAGAAYAATAMRPQPLNKGENEFARQAKYGATAKPAAAPSPEPSKATVFRPKAYPGPATTFQKTPSVGPDATKFASAKPAAPAAAAPAKSSGVGLNTAISDIAKTNKIKDVNKIYTGQKLDLGAGDKYTVQKGDNLTKIAKGFYGTENKASAPKPEPAVDQPQPAAQSPGPEKAPLGPADKLAADTAKKKAEGPIKNPTIRSMQESVQVGDNKYRIV
jgi:LysM repeat protein